MTKPTRPGAEPPIVPPPRIRKWRRVRSTPVARFRVMDVSRVELEDSDGRDRGEVFTLECRDWCNVVAITPDDQVVLVWQYRFGTDALSLEIPGGVIDEGETPEHAALRELREESGYEADRLEPLLVVEANPAIQNNRCHSFVARGARPTAPTKFDAQEELETALVPVARLGALLDSGQVTHGLIHGALAAFLRRERR
jgi:ADP-ribose pyrophosphatase